MAVFTLDQSKKPVNERAKDAALQFAVLLQRPGSGRYGFPPVAVAQRDDSKRKVIYCYQHNQDALA